MRKRRHHLLSCGLEEGTPQFLTEMLEGSVREMRIVIAHASLFNGLSGMIVQRHLTAFGWHGDHAEEC